MKKRISIILVLLLSVIPVQFVAAEGPISQEQLQVYKSGIKYFDINEVTIRTGGGGSSGGGTPTPGTGQWSWPTDRHMIGDGNPDNTTYSGQSCIDPQNRQPQSRYGCAGYGWRKLTYSFHDGVDIWSSCGVDVHPVDSGTILSAENTGGAGSYGNMITIDHGNGRHSFYGHLQSFSKTSGSVTTSDVIAKVGNTGGIGTCHLHLGREENGADANPEELLP